MSQLLQYLPMQALAPQQQMLRYLDNIYRSNPAAFDDDALSELAGMANSMGMDFKPEFSTRRMSGILGGNFMDALTMGLMPDKYIPKAVTKGEATAGRLAALPGLALTALVGGVGGWKAGASIAKKLGKSSFGSAANRKYVQEAAEAIGTKLKGWQDTGNMMQKGGSKIADFLIGSMAGANPTQMVGNQALLSKVPGMLGKGLLGGAGAGAAMAAMPYMFERNAGDVLGSAITGGAFGALAGPTMIGSPGFLNTGGLAMAGLGSSGLPLAETAGLSALGGVMGMARGGAGALMGGGARAAMGAAGDAATGGGAGAVGAVDDVVAGMPPLRHTSNPVVDQLVRERAAMGARSQGSLRYAPGTAPSGIPAGTPGAMGAGGTGVIDDAFMTAGNAAPTVTPERAQEVLAQTQGAGTNTAARAPFGRPASSFDSTLPAVGTPNSVPRAPFGRPTPAPTVNTMADASLSPTTVSGAMAGSPSRAVPASAARAPLSPDEIAAISNPSAKPLLDKIQQASDAEFAELLKNLDPSQQENFLRLRDYLRPF